MALDPSNSSNLKQLALKGLVSNLDIVDGERLGDDRYSIVNVTGAVQDVSQVQQRNVAVFVRHKVQSTARTLDAVGTMSDYTPVQRRQAVQHPTWTDFLQPRIQPTDTVLAHPRKSVNYV